MRLIVVGVGFLALLVLGYGLQAEGDRCSSSALSDAQAAAIVAGGGVWEDCQVPPATGGGTGAAAAASCRALNGAKMGCAAHTKAVSAWLIPLTSCNTTKCAFACPNDFMGMKLCMPQPWSYCTEVEEPALNCGMEGLRGDCIFHSTWANMDGFTWVLTCTPHDCVQDGNPLDCGKHGGCY